MHILLRLTIAKSSDSFVQACHGREKNRAADHRLSLVLSAVFKQSDISPASTARFLGDVILSLFHTMLESIEIIAIARFCQAFLGKLHHFA